MPNPAPYYHLVPKAARANFAFREKIIRWGSESTENARALWIMCKRDPLFYINTFCWTFNSKKAASFKHIPFITYPFQDDTILDILWAIDNEIEVVIDKTRQMGASWMLITCFEYLWHFRSDCTFLLASRKEPYVDKKNDIKSLMVKIDYLHKWQPGWMLPIGRIRGNDDPNRTALHLQNGDNGSIIIGESTNTDLGRGETKTAIGLDECAAVDNLQAIDESTSEATGCRVFNSTPGNSTYAAKVKAAKLEMKKPKDEREVIYIPLHWTQHPIKNRGMSLDKKGKPTSPAYRKSCAKLNWNKASIARELDMDHGGANYPVFDLELIEELKRTTAIDPVSVGRLDYQTITAENPNFVEDENGDLLLWCQLDPRGFPSRDWTYVIGCDVAVGTGASNSVASVCNRQTGEKVAEFACPTIDESEFGIYAVALCKFFTGRDDKGALLIWEKNGPGQTFGKKAWKDLEYRPIYYQLNEDKIVPLPTDKPGFQSSKVTKRTLIDDYQKMLKSAKMLNRYSVALDECKQYVHDQSNFGSYVHTESKMDDPTGARENHGDRVIADALCAKILVEDSKEEERRKLTNTRKAPVNSMAGRYEQRMKDAAEKERRYS